MAEVWEYVRDNARRVPVLAIIDSGFDYTHPDLATRMWHNLAEENGQPGVDDDGNGYVDDVIGWDFTDAPSLPGTGDYLGRDNDPMDEMGHGTLVAGVAGAAIDNGIGIAGVDPVSRLMNLRAGALMQFGTGFLEDDDIAAAMVYAVENGADVINMSFGDVVSSPLMHDAVRYADAMGVVLIAAAGNERTPELLYPAAYDETVAIGATAETGGKAELSSYGENLDICAPGLDIWTTQNGGGYQTASGTSLAAPYVTGAVGIILSLMPDLSPDRVRSMLHAGVRDLGAEGWDPETGFGELHLPALLAASSEPLAVILAPTRPAGADTAIGWAVAVSGAPPVAWSLGYGPGTTPAVWTAIDAGVVLAGADSTSGTIDTGALPEGVYALRLQITDGQGSVREDRTLFTVDHSAPRFTRQPIALPRWQDARSRVFLEWATDDRTSGFITLEMTDGSGHVALPLESESDEQTVDVTTFLTASGEWRATVTATNRAGQRTESAVCVFTYDDSSIRRSGLRSVGAVPAGVAMQQTADFNGNGIPELVVKPASEPAYGQATFYEYGPAGYAALFQSAVAMRPSAACDLDGNGLQDLIGYRADGNGVFSVAVVGQSSPGGPPETMWWEESRRVAPSVADLDGDGRQELIVLDDTDRTRLLIYTSPAQQTLMLATTVSLPEELPGEFGIWRAVLDRDGDGHMELVAGTDLGAIVIYRFTSVTDYELVATIAGSDDATRVWGGADLSGDGLPDFAVLRYVEENEYEPDTWYFSMEIYGTANTPLDIVDFSDPRPRNTAFASGPVAPVGGSAFAVAFPPRIYLVGMDSPAEARPIWFSDAGDDCLPIIADLTGDGTVDLGAVVGESLRVFATEPAGLAPAAPDSVSARSYGAATVEVSWEHVTGLAYRVWTGQTPDALTLAASGVTRSPYRIAGLATGVPLYAAVQAVDRSIADSVGAASAIVHAVPQSGPTAVEARIVGDGQVFIQFDATLDLRAVDVSAFSATVDGSPALPRSVIVDHSETRVLVSFAPGVFVPGGGHNVALTYSVRSVSGALGNSSVTAVDPGAPERPAIAYSYAEDDRTIVIGFTHPLCACGLPASSVALIDGPSVTSVTDREDGGYAVALAADLDPTATYVLTVSDVETAAGSSFSSGAVIAGPAQSAQGAILAVVQRSASELWVVLDRPLDFTKMVAQDALVTPVLPILAISQGPSEQVLVILLEPTAASWRWNEEYRVGVYAHFPDGTDEVLLRSFTPMTDRPLTGHLIAAEILSETHVRVTFDEQLAQQQPEGSIRIEPGLQIADIAIGDSTADITVSPETRLGPWGLTYYVRAESLLTSTGQPLYEAYPLRPAAAGTLDSLLVFPQPFRPAVDEGLVFGGLPEGTALRIYSTDGALVRSFDRVNTGGVRWDATNEAGRAVSSGVYLYIVESPGESRRGRFVIVR